MPHSCLLNRQRAAALGSLRCPLAVTTARRPVFPPSTDCRREVEGIMWGTRRLVHTSVSMGSCNESAGHHPTATRLRGGNRQPRGMHNKRRTQLA